MGGIFNPKKASGLMCCTLENKEKPYGPGNRLLCKKEASKKCKGTINWDNAIVNNDWSCRCSINAGEFGDLLGESVK
jgi:hypothetical protein